MNAILRLLILPPTITGFERAYLRKLNRIGLYFFLAHIPAFTAIAWLNDTGPLLAAALTVAVALGPALANATLTNPRHVSLVYGVTAMAMGGVLVHVGQGPMQIEMHFYFFALLAMLAVFGNPLAIVVATVAVALHHLLLWLWLPASAFNYDASVWVVAVHAAFVVLEAIATCFIARSFFDNVIGLERIVAERTAALDQRNRDLRLVLDHVQQGLVTINLDGVMSPERSAMIEAWFGPAPGPRLHDYLDAVAPAVGDRFAAAWAQVVADVLPLEVALDQLPPALTVDGRRLQIDYQPIMAGDALAGMLVVFSDVTAIETAARLEVEQRDVSTAIQHIVTDRGGFLEFLDEARAQVATVLGRPPPNLTTMKRMVHTLKGNAAILDIQTVADACEALEARIAAAGVPDPDALTELQARWHSLEQRLAAVLDRGRPSRVEVLEHEYVEVLTAARGGAPAGQLAEALARWRLEPVGRRLRRVQEQALRIARRLGKDGLAVELDDGGVRLDPARWAAFWNAFIHVVRNAVDHGIESPAERQARGKPAAGRLTIRAATRGDRIQITVTDDGRGIDWSAVAERARQLGGDASTQGELAEALFVDGLSTAPAVGEFSGRGVGLGAVRAACAALGGDVAVDSQPGRGTCVRFEFPLAACSDGDRSRAA